MKKALKKETKSSETRREMQHAAVVAKIRKVATAISAPEVLREAMWEEQDHDLDTLVDAYARTHYADGYRDPRMQKDQLDALQVRLVNRGQYEVNEFAERWYSRYLMAADVGYEMGFAAAMRLQKGAA